uniref:Uncharacterized protein n=1 Tax=Rhizophora mucronata TaxID=61149 RepID=A0A2P2N160_RHIMU
MDNKTAWWASMSEDSFLKSFVMKYADEIPDVLKLYLEKTKHKS